MKWNWQRKDWPRFSWDKGALAEFEASFLKLSGTLLGATKHFNESDKSLFVVDLITSEAIKTSEIEGEYLNRDGVQSSIRQNFGLPTDSQYVAPAERGIAEMMTDLYKNFDRSISHSMLYSWHKMLTSGRRDIKGLGKYRTHEDSMQIVSSRLDKPSVHFEAPPSGRVKKEMGAFLKWWKETNCPENNKIPALTRAGLAHLYFVCIHPFEDGNGRIARALAEKSLAEHQGQPTLIALSQTIERNRKAYYNALENNNKHNQITNWLVYFAETVLDAQNYSLQLVEFLIEKTKLFDRTRGQLNSRQGKVINRMFREGLEGFKGGLSAENYISITGTSRATATRDLRDLVKKGALLKTGELKSTRYHLNCSGRNSI